MKQEKHYFNGVNCLNRKHPLDALAGKYEMINRVRHDYEVLPMRPPLEKRKQGGCLGGAGGKLCNGPPGRARSPGLGDGLFPEHPPDVKAYPVGGDNQINKDDLSLKQIPKFNYYTH
jgi:hypothetical protein